MAKQRADLLYRDVENMKRVERYHKAWNKLPEAKKKQKREQNAARKRREYQQKKKAKKEQAYNLGHSMSIVGKV